MFPGAAFPIIATTTPRVEGQFIWGEADYAITLTLHFLDLSGRCEHAGIAEIGRI